jgi:hypothetical protein
LSACGDTDDQAVTWPRPGAGLRAMSWSPIDQVQGQPSSAWRCCTTNLPAALQAFAVVSVTWSRSMSCAISHASIRSSVHSPCGRVPLRRPGCTPNAPKRRYEPSVRCSTRPVWVAAGRRTIDRNSFDASAVSKIGDRVAALVAREAQAFVPMIPPPLFVGKSSPLDPPHPAHRASFLERTTLSN